MSNWLSTLHLVSRARDKLRQCRLQPRNWRTWLFIVLSVFWVVLFYYLVFNLRAQAHRDFEVIEFSAAIQKEATLKATMGQPLRPGLISIESSDLRLSGDEFRPWPVELRLSVIPESEWGLPVGAPRPLLGHTIYSGEFNVSGDTLVCRTEFDSSTDVDLVISESEEWGEWIDLSLDIPQFVPRYDLTTLIYSGTEPEPGTFRLPPLKNLTIKFRLPAWASGVAMKGDDSETWHIGNPNSSISARPGEPSGQPLRLFLAVGDASNVLKGNIYYDPINPPIGLEEYYANRPTAVGMYVSSQQRPFRVKLTGVTRLKISGLSGEAPKIGKRFTADEDIEVTLSEGTLEVRGIARWEKEYYENKPYELKFRGNATSFKINEADFIDLESSRYEHWPSWQQILVVAYISSIPGLLVAVWRKLGSVDNSKAG